MRASLAILPIFVSAVAPHVSASEPNIRSATPLIHLGNNLDEKDDLGWCIDTRGRGYAETLHAHSCKPAGRGNDTQFEFDRSTGLIRSVPYAECMALVRSESAENPFGLRDCDTADPDQVFSYDATSGEIRPEALPTQCVVVGAGSASAGLYLSRALNLAPCAAVDARLKQWVVFDWGTVPKPEPLLVCNDR